jgi:cytochrome c-550 PedF
MNAIRNPVAAGLAALIATVSLVYVQVGLGHGDVQPQAVDAEGLEPLGDEWALENPYRLLGGEQYELAQTIGASGYNSNCARCHGLEAISGGIAPDLRMLEDGEFGDEWYMERVRNGYTQNGAYKMPPFEDILTQEAMWAIRSYTETRPRDE